MPRPKHLPRPGPGRNRHPQMTAAGELYAAALSIALDRTAHPLERARANLTMRELAEEFRTPLEYFTSADGKRRPTTHEQKLEPHDRLFREVVSDAIAHRAMGEPASCA